MPRKKVLGAANDDHSNKPWTSNYPPLEAWLDKHNAQCMYQLPTSPRQPTDDEDWQPRAYVEMYLIGGRPCIVIIHANKMGWEIYTPIGSTKITETFADAEQRLGIGDASDAISRALYLADVALLNPPVITEVEVEELAKAVKTIFKKNV
jgi:hypothetical protein